MAEKRVPDRAERTVKKYAAFISYRHLSPDKEIAQALHTMLEHNQVRPNRHAPRNIRPVFLDTGELPILEDLDAGILEALENSECLYVICSPNLPLSKYCMREIDYFKKIHGGSTRRIYTLLVAGEPGESFPPSLRSQTKLVKGEDGVERAETVECEPLFADVRAPSLRESIRKLRRTEYLRLAAAYYGCSYDELYKRRLRWMIRVGAMAAAGVLAVAGGFRLYAHVRNLQYDAAKAATYASYAQEAAQEGDELLALTLCEEGWEAARSSGSQQYMTALRSAALQHDYKQRALPVSPVTQVKYTGEMSEVFYISEDGSKAITDSDNIFQISDTKTGEVLLRRPTDSVALDAENISHYVTVEAVQDADGVFHDTMTLRLLADNSIVGSFPFRLTQTRTPKYKLLDLTRDHSVMALSDSNEIVAYMDAEGRQLTQAEAEARMQDAPVPQAEDAPFYVAAGKRKKPPAVKNSAGETMLELQTGAVTAFSPDYAHFAVITDGVLQVYETEGFARIAECAVGGDMIQKLHLLQDSCYALCVYRTQDWWWRTEVIDWRTGEIAAQMGGDAVASGTDNAFYSMDDGVMTRYIYNDMEEGAVRRILAQRGDLCLAAGEGEAVLADTSGERILAQIPCSDPKHYAAAQDLSRLLLETEDGLACYDAKGQRLFAAADAEGIFALSADGSLAAWLDAQGGVQVVSAADGAARYAVPAEAIERAGWLNALAVGPDGLCAAGSDGALWLPEGGKEAVWLGEYDGATLFEDGMLILESGMAYVMDFAVYDVKKQAMVCRPQENTGEWAYSPKTGFLARRTETSGSHPALEMEVMRIADGKAQSLGRLALEDLYLASFYMDSAGEYLSVTAGDVTSVYRLRDLSLQLRTADAPVYYEDGRFWSGVLHGAKTYCAPMLEGDALHEAALSAITGTAGQRTLSLEERARFSFEE